MDALLRQAGWDPADKSQVRAEVSVSGASAIHDAPVGTEVSEQEDSRRTDYVRLAAPVLAAAGNVHRASRRNWSNWESRMTGSIH